MDFEKLMENRYSCRAYNDKKIEGSIIDEVLNTAILSFSACNSQPYKIHVVSNNEFVEGVREACMYIPFNRFTKNVNTFFIIEEIKGNASEEFGVKSMKNDFKSIDIGILSSVLTLALKDKGVDSCILGAYHKKKLAELLNIQNEDAIRLVIPCGYTDGTLPKKKRKSFDDIIVKH